jgi:hypothetical protein
MNSRTQPFGVILLASALVWVSLASAVRAANSLPLADAWNITSTGKASSSGELLFRVAGESGRDPVEVTVFVLSGTNETGVASSIRRALATQLDGRRFNVEAGEGANVLLTADRGNRGFSLELVDSDVDDVRVMVRSATPIAPPTVPPQKEPANPVVTPATPAAPGDAAPPADVPATPPLQTPGENSSPTTPAEPAPAASSAPPASSSSPPATPSAPPEGSQPANGGAGAPASAPPPPPGNR